MSASATFTACLLARLCQRRGSVSLGRGPRSPPCRSAAGSVPPRYALYRLPVKGPIIGTCILIGGCKHDPEGWFYRSPKCNKCLGAARWQCSATELGGGGTSEGLLGSDFSPFSTPCPPARSPACLALGISGLPEEVAHTKQCLAAGYAVLALMSKNRAYEDRCFRFSGNATVSECAPGTLAALPCPRWRAGGARA